MMYALLHRTAVLLMTLGAGTTRTTAVRLTDVQTISGRVTDLAGNPAAQIVVRLIEATRSLRTLLPSARVVVVTSSASDADRCGARGAGAHAFLTKGLGSDALVEATLSAVSEPVR